MNSREIERLEALKKERETILSGSSILLEGMNRISELDSLIEDIERDYDSMRVHELSLSKEPEIDSFGEGDEDYGDYKYGEISSSFKDPNLDY